jgi:hypothetical protein
LERAVNLDFQTKSQVHTHWFQAHRFIIFHLQHLSGSDFIFQTHMFRLRLDFRLTGSYPYISASGLSFVMFIKQVHKTRFRFHKNKFTYSQLRFYRFTNRGSQNKFTKKYKQVHKRRTGGLLLMCQLLCEIHWYVNRYMHAHCYTNRNMHVHCNGINMIKYIDMQKW